MFMMSSSRKLVKGCLGLVVLLGFVGFMIVEAHHHHHHHIHRKARIRGGGVVLVMRKEGSGNMKQLDLIVTNMAKSKKHRVLSLTKFNYINRRRVPNGPDPIHNRGAAKSHRPPGHA